MRGELASITALVALATMVAACSRLSGLDSLTRDDCVADACDGGRSPDSGTMRDASDETPPPRTFVCGKSECVVGRGCCLDADSGSGTCHVELVEPGQTCSPAIGCDDDGDCQVFGAGQRCCQFQPDLSSSVEVVACASASAPCSHPVCNPRDGAPACPEGQSCLPYRTSGMHTCQ